ncbi:MAG: type III secretion inner membrane ring lipoprotein SctJ, partial [Pseudomonadota bacterium]
VSACKVELHSGLTEQESNEMLALLLSHGIDAEKGTASKEGLPLMVESADLAQAIELLRENGLPGDTFNDLGTVFAEQGLISSPLEERVRFIYGLSQTISETLTQIDGVITARVQVIVPEQHPLEDEPQRSTASVFLKTRPGVSLEDKIPEIKMLVQNSVQGLVYEDIAVAQFEAQPARLINTDGPPLQNVFGVRFTRDSSDTLMMMLGAAGAVLLALIGTIVALFQMLRRAQRKASGATNA